MASATLEQEPFRFLDLPVELRCCVYENIESLTTWHVLDRTQAFIDKISWPVPPRAQIYDSRVTLIRPHTEFAIDILATCHLINNEARQILERKIEQCRLQPIRYLVDYSAAWALIGLSPLRSCLGLTGVGMNRDKIKTVKTFLRTCARSLSRTRETQNGTRNSVRGVRVIEMTITHKSDVVYNREVLDTTMWLGELKFFVATRLVVIYQSPLPKVWIPGHTQTTDSSNLEEVLQRVSRDPEISGQESSDRGVFVRPLDRQAFEKHVEGLESY